MRKPVTVCLSAIMLTTLAGCQTSGGNQFSFLGNKCETFGTVLGGIAGGLAGSQFGKGQGNVAAILAGVALGTVIGNKVGGLLDCEDQKAAAVATQQAAAEAKPGEKVYWRSTTAPEVVTEPVSAESSKAVPVQPAIAAPADVAASQPSQAGTAKVASKPKPAVAKATGTPPKPAVVPAAVPAPREVKPEITSAGSSGNWGWVEPTGTPYQAKNGQLCRDLRQVVVTKDGREVREENTSCQTADGKWLSQSTAGMG